MYFVEKTDELVTKLVGSGAFRKDEDIITMKRLARVTKDFNTLKSFWSKACFLVFLELHKNDAEIRAIGGKLKRELQFDELAIFKRHIEPYYSEIKRLQFSGKIVELAEKVSDALYERGEDEFVCLCRCIFSAKLGSGLFTETLATMNVPNRLIDLIKEDY